MTASQAENTDTTSVVSAKSSQTETMRVRLPNGLFALVDAEDYERVANRYWYVSSRARCRYAVRRMGGRRELVMMHRFIMDAKPGEKIDHINHDGLDNRKCNLRACTHSQNLGNSRKRIGTTSKYKGVCALMRSSRLVFRAKCQGKIIGEFEIEEVAARAYDEAAVEVFGEFANVNFPGSFQARRNKAWSCWSSLPPGNGAKKSL